MQLGETIATYDIDLALRGESGKFEVTSPNGETYFVTCRPNQPSLKFQFTGGQTYPQAFLVRKIAESVSLEQSARNVAMTEQESVSSDSHSPFLLENGQDENLAPNEGPPMQEETGQPSQPEAWKLDLFYIESEACEPPMAVVVATKDGVEATSGMRGPSLTIACRNYNELDSQIRRLHSQLEDIRVQAKKKFYRAQASAASA